MVRTYLNAQVICLISSSELESKLYLSLCTARETSDSVATLLHYFLFCLKAMYFQYWIVLTLLVIYGLIHVLAQNSCYFDICVDLNRQPLKEVFLLCVQSHGTIPAVVGKDKLCQVSLCLGSLYRGWQWF